jgi:diaminopimelate epimerase
VGEEPERVIPFWKVHGLGNDFVLLDAARGAVLPERDQARFLCHRHLGIGADGVLTVLPSEVADARMHIYNADGSEPEMCGNGIRCFVKYLVDAGRVAGPEVRVETGRGVLVCQAHPGTDGRIEAVTVNMGPAEFDRERVPMLGGLGPCVQQEIDAGELKATITAVSMGNPHMVLFKEADLAMARKYGPLLESHPLFPEKVNVNLAEVKSRGEIDLVVYERGCGITQACGTGACASTAAAARADKVDLGREVKVNLPGGSLWVRIEPDYSAVWMRGPAVEVFRGEFARVDALPGHP